MSRLKVMGIDPGVTGGISLHGVEDGSYDVIAMPATNEEAALTIQRLSRRWEIVLAVIERVQSMPDNAATTMLTYGKHAGFLEAACLLSAIPLRGITPQTWQKTVTGLLGERPKPPDLKSLGRAELQEAQKAHKKLLAQHRKETKKRSIQIAKQRYPNVAGKMKTQDKDGLADALHIGRYGLTLYREG